MMFKLITYSCNDLQKVISIQRYKPLSQRAIVYIHTPHPRQAHYTDAMLH